MRTLKGKITFESNGMIVIIKNSMVIMIGLIPWIRIAIGVIEKVGVVGIRSLLYPTIRRFDVAHTKEMLMVLAFTLVHNLPRYILMLIVEIAQCEGIDGIFFGTSQDVHPCRICFISHPPIVF